jgi:hypothetical protein
MFKKWIATCFGINHDKEDHETICFNSINKLIIVETAEKLPDLNNKWKIIEFIDKANLICENILGGTIEFIIQNPNEIVNNKTKSVKYIVNMFNKKTKLILHILHFNFKYDVVAMGTLLYIKPITNESVASNHWNFIESLFYNMGFQIRKKYHKNQKNQKK